ncbi:GntR family transcriptional regulator [Chelatococcus sp. GCM10030263]|uniref:GntR family transcriptional regulator n=1 Tax=Chelatococcus sp. GCM10030263 TaxID=3273387 RepID=UPI003623EBA2
MHYEEASAQAIVEPTPKASPRSAETAYRRVKQRILDNVYAPGTQVLEQVLADDLGISRTPVREALVRLAQEGLVAVVPRHGMRVLPLSPDDMREIYEVLTSLEPTAIALLAARHPSAAESAPLVEACAAMEAALARDDLDGWAKADERFHLGLVELCGNRRLAAMVMTVWDQSHRARMFTLKLRPKPIKSTREHRAALQAILDGDADRARELYRRHRERAAVDLMSIIERYGLTHL